MTRNFRSLILTAGLSAALLASLVAAYILSQRNVGQTRADLIRAEFVNRLPNLRHLGSFEEARPVFHGTLNSNMDFSDVIFIGSSFMWGYPMREDLTLPHYYSVLTGERVRNISVYGSNTDWSVFFACHLEQSGDVARRLFVSIPYTNDVPVLAQNWDEDSPANFSRLFDCPHDGYNVSLEDALARMSREEFSLLLGRTPNNESRIRFAFAPLPSDYFTTQERYAPIRDMWIEHLTRHIRRLANVSSHLTILVPPVFFPAVERAGFEPRDIQIQIDDVLAACERAAEGRDDILCFSAGDEFMRTVENFANLTHPNARGYETLAGMIVSFLHERGSAP